ncbi:MAG: enoyl-CoA hydratase-related protein, partial [Acidimicrobiales bacterium]|nr:enoyl-CoA hydratase-related protein [Acidimicrobiales bacterium]
ADARIGAEGAFKIGLNEIAIGMPVPRFAVELARDRLSKRHFVAAVNHAKIFGPADALDAGYLDEITSPDLVEARSIEHAHQLATTLKPAAFQLTRTFMRGELAKRLQQGMDEDMKLFDIKA